MPPTSAPARPWVTAALTHGKVIPLSAGCAKTPAAAISPSAIAPCHTATGCLLRFGVAAALAEPLSLAIRTPVSYRKRMACPTRAGYRTSHLARRSAGDDTAPP